MKTIRVRVIPNSKKNEILEEENIIKVRLKARAEKGRANAALIEFLSEHFGVRKSSIRIVKGEKAREKVIEIS